VGHEQREARLESKLLEHRDRLAQPSHEPDAEPAEGRREVAEAFLLEGRVARIPLRLPEHLRLVEHRRKHSSAPGPVHSRCQRRMIVHAEVSLEPDTDRGIEGHGGGGRGCGRGLPGNNRR